MQSKGRPSKLKTSYLKSTCDKNKNEHILNAFIAPSLGCGDKHLLFSLPAAR